MVMAEEHDEHTFLCGYQRARGYGSTARPQNSTHRYKSIIRHQVEPSDTLQGLVLRYNTSMTEIKRLNRLWSNESLYLMEYVNIPIYEAEPIASDSVNINSCVEMDSSQKKIRSQSSSSSSALFFGAKSLDDRQQQHNQGTMNEEITESVQELFKRIDSNIDKTKRLGKYSRSAARFISFSFSTSFALKQ
ncbi:unnamed protein product [Anisakis simplex]|uniref:LysM domain-containing protein n=1 Tax=Anisakis simplex TaxID=6269 RepID=A0A0M3JRJ3_ANISI|nr:unnamed protein product [Anisakis simplex]